MMNISLFVIEFALGITSVLIVEKFDTAKLSSRKTISIIYFITVNSDILEFFVGMQYSIHTGCNSI